MAERRFDVVLFGATGFTGALTAEYLAEFAPQGLRWALAGRNRAKLEQLRERLGPAAAQLELLHADIGEEASIAAVAEAAKVVITTVGPYISYGEPVVAACARAGTDYVDLTGEPEFVDRMWLAHHEEAQRSGARLVHSCGFDSIPYDLGTLFTVQRLPEGVPIHVDCFVRAGGTFSGGTYQSALNAMGRLRQGQQVARERRRREGRPGARRVRGRAGAPRHDARIGAWVVPFPTIDPQTVLRSARALERYGPDFSYGHYLAVKRLPVLAGLTVGAGALVAAAQVPPARAALARLKGSGEGPSAEQRARAWFNVRLYGEGGGRRVVTEVAGGDPGYGETSKMLAESALCLAFDELPERAGQLTPAVAMGGALIERLTRAGIRFRALEPAGPA
ncbi:MAG TPA: saccharopine dehydrogenase NADP-binding domain-containing protein [Solirubrobacteraceae bacterium]|nr:saccharopine dehydrogenase NADP-binding domain-containing protein [Solirubrobacteraceae bacterium]